MKGLLLFFLVFHLSGINSQENPDIGPQILRLSHRYDVRTKVNGKYLGLYYGGALGLWSWNDAGTVNARYFFEEQGIRDTRHLEKKVDRDVVTRFNFLPDGRIGPVDGSGGPVFRNFPYRPSGLEWKPGLTWVASGSIAWDWDSSGETLSIPVLTEYRVTGKKKDASGEDYWEVSALHALRYRGESSGQTSIRSIQGRHESTLQWRESQAYPFFFRIKLEEEIKTAENTIQKSGFWLNWYSGVIPMEKRELERDIKETLEENKVHDIKIEAGEEGIKLILQNLQFVADKAELLPGEEKRLDMIADTLKKIPDRSLVVTGHTADVGRPEEQQRLSLDRAKSIVEALKSRGIPAGRMYYRGEGAEMPLGDNSTPEGRAVNRRVEITILED